MDTGTGCTFYRGFPSMRLCATVIVQMWMNAALAHMDVHHQPSVITLSEAISVCVILALNLMEHTAGLAVRFWF